MVSHAHLKTDDRSDEKLIAEIATARSQDAFAELLRRYERGAYGLALRITSHRQAAEETVQEAMLRIWISASSYRGEGSVKGWILSVVARESIRTIKATKRKSNQMEADFNREQHEADPSPLEDVESAELADALRREVDGLPALTANSWHCTSAGALANWRSARRYRFLSKRFPIASAPR
jgi:RNA polymerase sigma factor (sigma-70 family)